MSPPGRPKGSYRRAKHEGTPLSAPDLSQAHALLVFNWLPAAYAHSEWIPDWQPGAQVPGRMPPRMPLRVLRRISDELLDAHQLRHRYLREVGRCNWVLWADERIDAVADLLGTAMLGAWVLAGIDRQQVSLQLACLGVDGRARALSFAHSLRALPAAATPERLGTLQAGAAAVTALGRSCLVALLSNDGDGARERFAMRRPPGATVPLELTLAQREDALLVIRSFEAQEGERGMTARTSYPWQRWAGPDPGSSPHGGGHP